MSEAVGSVRYPDAYNQSMYDKAFEAGILEEPVVFDPASGVTTVRIENGTLIETIEGKPDRLRKAPRAKKRSKK